MPSSSRQDVADEFTPTFAGLMGISLFGASIAWSTLFTASRGDLLLFSWAATAFISAGVAASGMSMTLKEAELDMSRGAADKLPRKMLHGFAACSGVLAFTGVILMSVAVMNLDQGNEDSGIRGLDADWRKRSNRAAGVVAIFLCCFFAFLPTGLNLWYKSQRTR